MMRRYRTAIAVLMLATAATTAAADGVFDFLKPKPKPDSGAVEDGDFTILLFVCRGAGFGHAEQAKRYKDHTEKHAGWKDLFVVHKEDHSLLFWGKYPTIEDAQKNLKAAKKYETPLKIKVFAKAIVVPVPGMEKKGPPEWDLDKTDPNWVYTVLIAEFHDVPEADYKGRRDFAVMYCKQLREEGRQAFYRHGEISSVVTVGLFKASAVTDKLVPQKTGRDKLVRTLHDPNITKLINAFPKLAVNGREKRVVIIDPETRDLPAAQRRYKEIAAQSYLTKIPREEAKDEPKNPRSPRNPRGYPQPGQGQGNPTGTRPPVRAPGRPANPRRN